MHAEERKRKTSNAEVSASMFNKLLLIEQEKETDKSKYEEQIQQLQRQLDDITAAAPRRASEIHTTMFNSLLEAEADHVSDKSKWEQQEQELKKENKRLSDELQQLKKLLQDKEKKQEESMIKMKDEMWNQLVDTNGDSNQALSKLDQENRLYKQEISLLKEHIRYLETSKMVMVEECSRQMNLLRSGVRALNLK